jgi:hypothetical protein
MKAIEASMDMPHDTLWKEFNCSVL